MECERDFKRNIPGIGIRGIVLVTIPPLEHDIGIGGTVADLRFARGWTKYDHLPSAVILISLKYRFVDSDVILNQTVLGSGVDPINALNKDRISFKVF